MCTKHIGTNTTLDAGYTQVSWETIGSAYGKS